MAIHVLKAKPDVIYIRNHFASFPTALMARLIGIPVIQEVNGPYEDLFIAWPRTRTFAPIFRWLTRTQLSWADAVVAVTSQLTEWVRSEAGNENVVVIPNGANSDLFCPQADLHYELPKPYVVFFGALAEWQGIDVLIQALDSSQWPTAVSLVIMGDGVERSIVEQACSNNSRIVYLGVVPYDDVPGIVAHSLAAVAPMNNLGGRSSTGLMPLKVFESMACGVPVIVTDFPGQADIVRQYQCGIVVPPSDPDCLALAVSALYADPLLRQDMGLRGRTAVESEHSWDHRAAQTDELLHRVVATRGRVKQQ